MDGASVHLTSDGIMEMWPSMVGSAANAGSATSAPIASAIEAVMSLKLYILFSFASSVIGSPEHTKASTDPGMRA